MDEGIAILLRVLPSAILFFLGIASILAQLSISAGNSSRRNVTFAWLAWVYLIVLTCWFFIQVNEQAFWPRMETLAFTLGVEVILSLPAHYVIYSGRKRRAFAEEPWYFFPLDVALVLLQFLLLVAASAIVLFGSAGPGS